MTFKENFESFMDFAGEAAQTAARKTRKLAEIAKCNLSVYAEEDKIKKAYAELGRLYYQNYVLGGEADTAVFEEVCRRIDQSKEAIADLQEYIDMLKTDRMVYDEEEVADLVAEADFADEDLVEVETEL